MNEAINFYGIDADKSLELSDWTRSDFKWRAGWHRSEYHALQRYERAQYAALVLGAMTGVLWASALVYILN